LWLRGEQPLDAAMKDLFAFEKQHYDVIILGDVAADRIQKADPTALKTIENLVREKGTGLLMMGGYASFGEKWKGTEIENLLPVKLDPVAGQIDGPVKVAPTNLGLAHFLLRLNKTEEDSKAAWGKM